MRTTLELRDAYYARVAPLFGEMLCNKTLGILGDEKSLDIALLLARCGMRQFAAESMSELLKRKLARQNPLEDRYQFCELDDADAVLLAPGAERIFTDRPTLSLSFPENTFIHTRLDFFPGGCDSETKSLRWPANSFDRADAINRTAAFAREMLLGANIPAQPTILIGHERWPWWIRGFDRNAADEYLRINRRDRENNGAIPRHGRVLIVGCGSLGSVAAMRLAPHVVSLVLCDPERVAIENPVRQEFGVDDVGIFKCEALARRCESLDASARGIVRAEEDSAEGVRSFNALLDREDPDLVILTTGTGAEFMAASVLRRRAIPHVAARCYARARYFEIIAVDGANGPCFHCLREQLHTGPAPSLTPEQKARYDPDYRPGELNAEPASIVESGRCADVLARIAYELLRPGAQRSRWLRETLAQQRNCFIGANHAERDDLGRWAYGLDAPGKVTTYGAEDVAGAMPGDRCGECGRAV